MELLKAIEAEAEKRCQEARDRAEEEIQRIRQDAEEQIRMKREAAREESKRKLAQQETVLLSQAETKVQRESAVVKNEIVEEAMSHAREALSRIPDSDEYAGIFRMLAEEAISEMKEDFTAIVRPGDEGLARSVLEELGTQRYEIKTNDGFLGGLVIESRDGRSRVINTLDARFERVREEAILQIAPILFE